MDTGPKGPRIVPLNSNGCSVAELAAAKLTASMSISASYSPHVSPSAPMLVVEYVASTTRPVLVETLNRNEVPMRGASAVSRCGALPQLGARSGADQEGSWSRPPTRTKAQPRSPHAPELSGGAPASPAPSAGMSRDRSMSPFGVCSSSIARQPARAAATRLPVPCPASCRHEPRTPSRASAPAAATQPFERCGFRFARGPRVVGRRASVVEGADVGVDHRDAVLAAGVLDVEVPRRAPRLRDEFHPVALGVIDVIAERDEAIRDHADAGDAR
jgi:hypothetical protein